MRLNGTCRILSGRIATLITKRDGRIGRSVFDNGQSDGGTRTKWNSRKLSR